MGSAIATAFVEIGANMTPLTAGLGKARAALSGFSSGMSKFGKSAANSFFSPFVAAAKKMNPLALIGGGLASGAGIGYVINKASELNETVEAVGVTFGASAGIVKRGAEEMAKAFGTPRQEFLDAAMGIGAIGKASGKTEAEAAALGVKFSKLAVDLSSMRNLPLQTALEKIRSGLVGEAEPLRAVGVLLSEAAVQSEALRLRLVTAHQEMTEGQKITARASLIAKQLADANGDLARTSGSVANQFREIGGRLQNMAADMGQLLLPATQALNKELIALVNDVQAGLERNKGMFAAWGQSLKEAAEFVGVLYRNWSGFTRIAGLKMVDWRDQIVGAFKSVFTFLGEWSAFFAETMRRAIEDAIKSAFKGTPLEVPSGGRSLGLGEMLFGAPGGLASDAAANQMGIGKDKPRKPLVAPVFKAPEVAPNPEIAEERKKIDKNEQADRGIEQNKRIADQAQSDAEKKKARLEAGAKSSLERANALKAAFDDKNAFGQRDPRRTAQVNALKASFDDKKRERMFAPNRPQTEDEMKAELARKHWNQFAAFNKRLPPGMEPLKPPQWQIDMFGAPPVAGEFQGPKKREKKPPNLIALLGPFMAQRLALQEAIKGLKPKAEGGDAEAKKLLGEAEGHLKALDKGQEFQSERHGVLDFVQQLQSGFLSRKSPEEETAKYSKAMFELLRDKLKNGNLAAVAGTDDIV